MTTDVSKQATAPAELSVRSFSGEHRWLSNFWESPIRIRAFGEDYEFSSGEHVFQMAKLEYAEISAEDQRALFLEAASLETPGRAKRFGRRIPDLDIESWNAVRDEAMAAVIEAKFSQSEELREKLLALEGYYIEEGNHWGDRYWGVDGTGLNKLGHILMELRDRWLTELAASADSWAPTVTVPEYFSSPEHLQLLAQHEQD